MHHHFCQYERGVIMHHVLFGKPEKVSLILLVADNGYTLHQSQIVVSFPTFPMRNNQSYLEYKERLFRT